MIIAIDGPAGAGKSTVCRMLAKALGYTYLDTGAMYRAVAWALLQEPGFDLGNEEELALRLSNLPLRFTIENGSLLIMHGEKILNEELRGPEITQQSSRVSSLAPVRGYLVDRQRELASEGPVVAEGRDMTTIVFPHAPVKVFLTADMDTRVERRLAEYASKGIAIDRDVLAAEIHQRDERDQKRALAPLRPGPGAVHLDTSRMTIDQVVDYLLKLVHDRRQQTGRSAE